MKALELLYQYQQADEIAGGYMSKSLEEAIQELENLQKEIKIKDARIENYQEAIVVVGELLSGRI